MKDRYANFFDGQQDPYEYDYNENDEGLEEELEDGDEELEEAEKEEELEDEEEAEEEGELGDEEEAEEEEELEDEEEEELEDEEEAEEEGELEDEEEAEEEEELEDREEDEEEEEVPVQRAAPTRPFGSGLNIQLGNLTERRDNDQDRHGNSRQNKPQPIGSGYSFKQVKPTVETPPPSPAQIGNNIRNVAASVTAGPSGIQHPMKATREESKQAAEQIGFRPVDDEEKDTPKRGLWQKIMPKQWQKRYQDEEIDEEELVSQTGEEETEDRTRRPGLLRRIIPFRGQKNESPTDEEADIDERYEDETHDPETARGFSRIREGISNKISSFSSRVRGRLHDGESLDEFKEKLIEEESTLPKQGSRLKKIGVIGGTAAAILAVGLIGYKHMVKNDMETTSTNTTTALEEQVQDTLSGLSSRADALTADTFSDNAISVDKVSKEIDNLGQKASDKINETINGVSDTISSNINSLKDDLLTNDDLLDDELGAAATAAVGTAAGIAAGIASGSSGDTAADGQKNAGEDQLDLDFGTPQAGVVSADPLDELSISSTTPQYGDNQSGGLTLEQIKSNLVETGEQIKDGLKSGIEKADDSFQKAGQKTGEFFENAGQKISDAAQGVKEDLAQAGDQAKDASQRVGDWASNTYENAKEKIDNATEELKGDLAQAGDQAKDASQRVGDWASNTYENTKEWTQDTAQQIGEQVSGTLTPQNQPVYTEPQTGQPLQLSLGRENESEPLFLNTVNRENSAASSLGGGASNRFQPTNDSIDSTASGRNALLRGTAPTTQDSPSSLSSNTAPATVDSLGNSAPVTQNTASATQNSVSSVQSSAPIEVQNAMAQEAVAAQNAAAQQAEVVQKQTPDETFAAETDLSSIGFEAPRVEDGDPLSESLSPFGGQYTLPEEMVPTGTIAAPTTDNKTADNVQTARTPMTNNSVEAMPNTLQSQQPGSNQIGQATATQYDNQTGYSRSGDGIADTSTLASGYRQYRTKTGDNLIKIAENELGDGSRWSEISRLNSDKNLRGRLQEGIMILLPKTDSNSEN